jgi:hypothetical protein
LCYMSFRDETHAYELLHDLQGIHVPISLRHCHRQFSGQWRRRHEHLRELPGNHPATHRRI